MGTNPFASSISAYKSVATHGVVQDADPHQLICLLMDGALQRLAVAKAHMQRKEMVNKATVLHRVSEILLELKDSLNLSAGGEVANGLDALYDYMVRRLLQANLNNDVAIIDEVTGLLKPVRDAWFQIAPQAKQVLATAHNKVAP